MRSFFALSKLHKSAVRMAAVLVVFSAVVGVFASCGGSISDIPDPSTDYYVSDFAEVISSESAEYICTLASALDGVSGAQIVIVTLPTLDGYAIDRYASALFSGWSVGDGEKNNGIMLLMCPSEGEYWMIHGDGLRAALGDGVLKAIMTESLEPYFAAGDYDGGARGIFDALYKKLCSYYNVSPVPDSYDGGTYNGAQAYDAVVSDSDATGRTFMILILIVVIVAAFVLMIRILLRGVLGVGDGKGRGVQHGGYATGATRGRSHAADARRTASPSHTASARTGAADARQSSRGGTSARSSGASGGTASQRSAASRRGSAAYDALRRGAQDDDPRTGR